MVQNCGPPKVCGPVRPNTSNMPKAGPARFTYPRVMEGWVDLGYPAMNRSGTELAISRSQVQRLNHYTAEQPICGEIKIIINQP